MNEKPKKIIDLHRLIYNAGISRSSLNVISLEKYASEQGRSYYDNLVIQHELFTIVEKCILENKSITIKDYLNTMIKLESEYERD